MTRAEADEPVGTDLAARVDRLEAAMAAAGAALAGTGAGRGPTTPRRATTSTSATKKGVRTVLQVGLASIPGFGLAALTENATFMWVATFVLTPVVTYVQNAVEDHFRKGFLRTFDREERPSHQTGPDLAP